MTKENLSHIPKFALVLDAPILITGTEKNYLSLKPASAEDSRNMLSSWWGVNSKAELEETLHWLDQEGGHTIVFHQVLDELYPLTYQQQLARVESARQQDRKEGIRFATAFQYLYDLSEATIYAYDVARYIYLVKTGFSLDWFSEDEVWDLLIAKAHSILEKTVFPTHEDYLLSYAVGRTFSMGHDSGDIKQTNAYIKTLITNPQSPYINFINWTAIVQNYQSQGGAK